MKILYLTGFTQIDPVSGLDENILNKLQYLAKSGLSISLVAFVSEEALEHLSRLKEVCAEVYAVPYSFSGIRQIRSWLKSLVNGQPFLIEWANQSGMRHLLEGLFASQYFDVIHTDKIYMIQYALMGHRLGRIDARSSTRAHLIPATGAEVQPALLYNSNDDSPSMQKRIHSKVAPVLRPMLSQEARLVQEYEEKMARICDQSLTVVETNLFHIFEYIRKDGKQLQPVSLSDLYPSTARGNV